MSSTPRILRTKLAVGEVASIDRAIDIVRERLGLRSRLQVALVCTLGAVATAISTALIMPLMIAAGLLWILWETARRIAGSGRGPEADAPASGRSLPDRRDASVPRE